MDQFWDLVDKHPQSFYLIAFVFTVAGLWRFFVGHFWPRMKEQGEVEREERLERLRVEHEQHREHREQIERMANAFVGALESQREASAVQVRELTRELTREIAIGFGRWDRPK